MPLRALNILVVEDHADSARALAALLRTSGHRSVIVHEAAAARALAAHTRFDLLLSDVGLPDGDGRGLLAEIRKRYPIVGIALSGYAAAEDAARSLEAGFAAHLTKPLCFPDLLRHIEALAAGDGHAPGEACSEGDGGAG